MKYQDKIFKSNFFMIIYLSVSSLFPESLFRWPTEHKDFSDKLTSLFGESRGDHFHNGVDISTVNQPVMSLKEGEILYSSYAEDRPFENPPGPGNSVWVYHGNGILSAYYHLRDGRNKNILEKQKVASGEIIGFSGNTGHSGGAHLHFVVADKFGKRIIDPLTMLSAVKDSMAPVISSLMIYVGDRFTNINDGDYINLSSNFPLVVRIADAGEKKFQNRGIKKAEYILNGELLKKARFDSLVFKDGKWMNLEGLTYDDLYFKDDYLVGAPGLRSGENSIKIMAEDYSGNKSERTFVFYVNRTK